MASPAFQRHGYRDGRDARLQVASNEPLTGVSGHGGSDGVAGVADGEAAAEGPAHSQGDLTRRVLGRQECDGFTIDGDGERAAIR